MPAISRSKRHAVRAALLLAGCGVLAGCHHKERATAYQPPPPLPRPGRQPARPAEPTAETPSLETGEGVNAEWRSAPPGYFDDIRDPPVYSEVGVASWYITNYRGRPMANGSMGVQDAMTAAHRTLPMGSTVRVTNLTNGEQVLVRITDRGPFVPGRSLDLSQGAAKAIGVYRAGIAKVRIEAYAHPGASVEGKWCVQAGVYASEQEALEVKATLIRHYHGAQVSEFHGMTGYWVRIDPANHDRASALEMQRWIGGSGPNTLPYLVRVD